MDQRDTHVDDKSNLLLPIIEKNNMIVVFMTITAVKIALYSITIIFYVEGRSFKTWIHKNNLFRRAGLD